MSAPDTNVEKQTRRHKPSLTGIAVAILGAGAIMIAVSMWSQPTDPLVEGSEGTEAIVQD
ncbi:hypothetical protein N9L47_12335 [Rhodobacteraceae bacterium]|nr:hypothetical protein [Paracoccaceae bacterium]